MGIRNRIAFAVAGVFAMAAPVLAQPPASPAPSPAFSPYLNLVRQGASPAINYFGLVKPQTQFSNSLQSLQNQVNQNSAYFNAGGGGGDQPLVTGNAFGYQNHLSYFQNHLTAGGLGTGAAGSNLGRPMAPTAASQQPPPGTVRPTRSR